KSAKFKGKVRGAMIYPAVILVVIVVVIGLLMVVLVPTITSLFADFGSELPLATRIIVAISNFTVSYWYIILIAVVGIVAGFIYYRKTPSGREVTDDLILKAPVFGSLIQKSQIASMARTLQMLMKSGIPILDSLEITKGALSNVHFQKGLADAKLAVEKGSSLAVPLAKNERFPILLSRMVAVGEETGKLDEVLGKIASYYEDEVDQMADNLSAALEPLMLILMGTIVAFIAIAVYYPLFSLGDVIK
ncbi:type II secretion system F family protein, partial [Candidatus Dojkabacteria bacterium]|nr:type II secretion system F family protein [Candidatus Dojkabacteria bacterium]